MPILLEGEGRTPTWEDIDALSSKIQYQIYVEGPEILAAIAQRCQKEREEQRKFRDDSELLRPGQPDTLGKIHKSSGSRYSRGLFNKIIVAQAKHEHPPKTGWGPHKNMTRAEFGKHVTKVMQEKRNQDGIDAINLAFSDAEMSSRR